MYFSVAGTFFRSSHHK